MKVKNSIAPLRVWCSLCILVVLLDVELIFAQVDSIAAPPQKNFITEMKFDRSNAIALKNAKKHLEKQIQAIKPDIENWYTLLHRNPELGYHERKTANFLATLLGSWGWKVTSDVGGSSGLFAEWTSSKPGKTILIKVAMDALPYTNRLDEKTQTEQITHNFGGRKFSLMHGAGHDADMAIALGFAKLISRTKNSVNGKIIIAFQSGEYSTTWGRSHGADIMLYSDYFIDNHPDFAIAYQFNPSLELGKIAFQKDMALPSATIMNITLYPKQNSMIDFVDNTQTLYTAFAQIIVPFQRIVYEERFSLNQPIRVDFNAINGAPFVDVPAQSIEASAMIFAYNDEALCRTQDRLAWSLFASAESMGVAVAPSFYNYSPSFKNNNALCDLLETIGFAGKAEVINDKQFYFNSFSKYAQAAKAGGFFYHIGAGIQGSSVKAGTFNLPSDRFAIAKESLTKGLLSLFQIVQLTQKGEIVDVPIANIK